MTRLGEMSMTSGDYRREIKDLFRLDDYKHRQGVLVHLLVHYVIIAVVLVGCACNAQSFPWWLMFLGGLVAGHSALVAAVAGHELGHGAGRMPTWVRRVLESLGWSFALFATPTIQRKAHNVLHHGNTNNPRDPDRRLMLAELDELGAAPGLFEWLLPNGRHPLLTRIWGFSLMVFSYHLSLLLNSSMRTGEIHDVGLTDVQRRQALFEFGLNLSAYGGLWALSDYSSIMAGTLVLTYFTVSTLAGMYTSTNHLLNGMVEHGNDPLMTTASLKVPAWLDFLHLNFSHHTEHHLYPSASHEALPAVRMALRERFAERYCEIEWREALRILLAAPMFMKDSNTNCFVDGSGAQQVTFPTLTA